MSAKCISAMGYNFFPKSTFKKVTQIRKTKPIYKRTFKTLSKIGASSFSFSSSASARCRMICMNCFFFSAILSNSCRLTPISAAVSIIFSRRDSSVSVFPFGSCTTVPFFYFFVYLNGFECFDFAVLNSSKKDHIKYTVCKTEIQKIAFWKIFILFVY